MTYEIEGRNIVVYPDVAVSDEAETGWAAALVGQLGFTVVVCILSAAGLLVYIGAPVSLYCLGIAGVAFLFDRVQKRFGVAEEPVELWERIARGLVADTRLAAILLTLGLAAVWLLQLLLNLGDPGRADPIGALELHVYGWSERLTTAGSIPYMLAALLVALACSVAANSRRPLIVLGMTRKVLSGAIAFFAAASSFSFVAPAALAGHNDAAVGAARNHIAGELYRLAEARRERAALQWLAAEFTREARRNPDAPVQWRGYFARIKAACRARPDCNTDDLLVQLARQRTSPTTVYIPFSSPPLGPAGRWLPEYRAAIVEAPATRFDPTLEPAAEAPVVRLDERLRQGGDLVQMRRTAGMAADRAVAARDAMRSVVVEAVGEMLWPDFSRLADQIVDTWRNAIFDAFAIEGEARIAARLRALRFDVPKLFAAPPELAALPSDGFPLESPNAGLGRGRPLDSVVQADWEAMHAREASAAARELAFARQSFDSVRAGRMAYRPPPRPPARAPRVTFR